MAGQATVAKLNIMLGVNTGVMATQIKSQAIPILEGFKSKADSMGGTGGGDIKLLTSFKAAGGALNAMHGSMSGMASSMGAMIAGGPILAGIAAEVAALFAAAKFSAWGIKLAMGQDAEFTSKWKTFKDEFAELAFMIGKLFMPLIKWWLDVGIAAVRAMKGGKVAEAGTYDRLTDPEGHARKVKEANDKIIASGQEWSDAFSRQVKEIEDAAKRKQEAMVHSADQVTKSLRTPSEVFQDTLIELNELMNANLLTFGTYSRGIEKAADDFANLNNKAKELQQIQSRTLNVAALERGSSAELSARNRVESIIQAQADTAKQQLATQQRQEALEKQIRDILKANNVTFQPVNLR